MLLSINLAIPGKF